MKAILIEDDPSLALALRRFFETHGLVLEVAASIKSASARLRAEEWDFVLLDRMLPDGDGLGLIPEIRSLRPSASILVMTARDQISDRIQGLDSGADDYLVKPFNPDELLARMRAIERRIHSQLVSSVLALDHLEIDLGKRSVWCHGKPVELTTKQWSVLRTLLSRPNRIVTRQLLSESIYHSGDESESNTIEVFIHALRKRLQTNRIETIRGIGYRMNTLQSGEDG